MFIAFVTLLGITGTVIGLVGMRRPAELEKLRRFFGGVEQGISRRRYLSLRKMEVYSGEIKCTVETFSNGTLFLSFFEEDEILLSLHLDPSPARRPIPWPRILASNEDELTKHMVRFLETAGYWKKPSDHAVKRQLLMHMLEEKMQAPTRLENKNVLKLVLELKKDIEELKRYTSLLDVERKHVLERIENRDIKDSTEAFLPVQDDENQEREVMDALLILKKRLIDLKKHVQRKQGKKVERQVALIRESYEKKL